MLSFIISIIFITSIVRITVICIVLTIIVTMMLLKLTSMAVVRATPGLIQPFKDSGVGDAALNLTGRGSTN